MRAGEWSVALVLPGTGKEDERGGGQSRMFQTFSLQSPKVHFTYISFLFFFNMQLPSRNLTWIVHFKNHGRVLLFFQIPSLEVLLVQIRRNKSAVTSWGHLEKFIFKMQ